MTGSPASYTESIIVLIWLMALEGVYTEDTRVDYYGESTFEPQSPPHH